MTLHSKIAQFNWECIAPCTRKIYKLTVLEFPANEQQVKDQFETMAKYILMVVQKESTINNLIFS